MFIAQVTPTPTPYGFAEFIRDPGWQFGGAVVAIIGVLIAYLLFWAERQRKQLDYEVLVRTPLISIREEEELEGRLSILLDGQPLPKPDLETVVVRLTNSGNVPVDDEDFSGPIKLSFGDNAEVLTAAVIKTEPKHFEAMAQVEPDAKKQVLLSPVLLNKGQSVTIKSLVRQAGTLNVYGHIKGVELRNHQERKSSRSFVLTLIGIACVLLSLAGSALVSIFSFPLSILGFPIFALLLIGAVLVFLS
jgi:hypothetical protein